MEALELLPLLASLCRRVAIETQRERQMRLDITLGGKQLGSSGADTASERDRVLLAVQRSAERAARRIESLLLKKDDEDDQDETGSGGRKDDVPAHFEANFEIALDAAFDGLERALGALAEGCALFPQYKSALSRTVPVAAKARATAQWFRCQNREGDDDDGKGGKGGKKASRPPACRKRSAAALKSGSKAANTLLSQLCLDVQKAAGVLQVCLLQAVRDPVDDGDDASDDRRPVVLWVDDQPGNNTKEAKDVAKKCDPTLVAQVTGTCAALSLLFQAEADKKAPCSAVVASGALDAIYDVSGGGAELPDSLPKGGAAALGKLTLAELSAVDGKQPSVPKGWREALPKRRGGEQSGRSGNFRVVTDLFRPEDGGAAAAERLASALQAAGYGDVPILLFCGDSLTEAVLDLQSRFPCVVAATTPAQLNLFCQGMLDDPVRGPEDLKDFADFELSGYETDSDDAISPSEAGEGDAASGAGAGAGGGNGAVAGASAANAPEKEQSAAWIGAGAARAASEDDSGSGSDTVDDARVPVTHEKTVSDDDEFSATSATAEDAEMRESGRKLEESDDGSDTDSTIAPDSPPRDEKVPPTPPQDQMEPPEVEDEDTQVDEAPAVPSKQQPAVAAFVAPEPVEPVHIYADPVDRSNFDAPLFRCCRLDVEGRSLTYEHDVGGMLEFSSDPYHGVSVEAWVELAIQGRVKDLRGVLDRDTPVVVSLSQLDDVAPAVSVRVEGSPPGFRPSLKLFGIFHEALDSRKPESWSAESAQRPVSVAADGPPPMWFLRYAVTGAALGSLTPGRHAVSVVTDGVPLVIGAIAVPEDRVDSSNSSVTLFQADKDAPVRAGDRCQLHIQLRDSRGATVSADSNSIRAKLRCSTEPDAPEVEALVASPVAKDGSVRAVFMLARPSATYVPHVTVGEVGSPDFAQLVGTPIETSSNVPTLEELGAQYSASAAAQDDDRTKRKFPTADTRDRGVDSKRSRVSSAGAAFITPNDDDDDDDDGMLPTLPYEAVGLQVTPAPAAQKPRAVVPYGGADADPEGILPTLAHPLGDDDPEGILPTLAHPLGGNSPDTSATDDFPLSGPVRQHAPDPESPSSDFMPTQPYADPLSSDTDPADEPVLKRKPIVVPQAAGQDEARDLLDESTDDGAGGDELGTADGGLLDAADEMDDSDGMYDL